MNKKTKKAIKQTTTLVVALIVVLVGISYFANEQLEQPEQPIISEAVQNYKPLIEKYAQQYHVASYVDVLLAIMMQESGGRGSDPMQASESYCGKIGCIKDPELSIKQGVYYFSETLETAGYDIELAIQSYNFGKGFIQYVQNQKEQYSQDIAIEFSREMYQNAPDQSIYSCLRKEAKQYNACYGDIYYVQAVMQYVPDATEQ
ncbi:lysozyme family protein [Ornithinibacillus contaminans]|uniref:lysozyme family protein n=1 Tax=Ornithinibacillus contaminans TaxID=694055 RepID=UPI00064D8DAF|nr:lysozyme family protein [Ornithinibacillus contaminans]